MLDPPLSDDKVIRCFGRLPDHKPVFIPKQSLYAIRLGEEVHEQVGHKGVNTMMARVREMLWIPRLRTVLKKIKGRCEKCKVMAAKPFPVPTGGQLPESRVTANYPFGVVGVDFVGPFQLKGKDEKAYVINFSCATSRAVYFTTTRNMVTSEFIDKLNEIIAVRMRPRKIISDNAQTFQAVPKFIKNLREKHDVTKVKPYYPEIGEIVLVVGDTRYKHEWKHRLVVELIRGRDEEVRGVRMVVNSRVWQRPIQLICPLEIKSTLSPEELNKRLQTAMKGEDVVEVLERPRRAARDRGVARTKDLLTEY